MDWDDFKFVQAIARTGSVRRAGELLKVHGSTVARHLDHLERRVGTRLFARTSRGMEITASGAEVIEVLDRVAHELDRVEQSLKSRGPVLDAPVTVALPAELAEAPVIPMLEELYRERHDLQVVLLPGQALEILERGDSDLALCVTDDPPDDLIGRPLGAVSVCAYGAPWYLERMTGADGNAAGRWVGEADPAGLSDLVRARYFPNLAAALSIGDVLLRATALETGLGVGVLPCHLGDSREGLVRAGGVEPLRAGGLWLFTRAEARGVARVQAVSAFLQEIFARDQDGIEGRTGSDPE